MWRLERAVVLAVLACIVILAVIGLGFYALHKVKPGWFRIQAGAGQRFTFSIEMGQGGDLPGHRPPRKERRELEAGRDQPRELEAGRGDSEPPGAAEQGNAVALRGVRWNSKGRADPPALTPDTLPEPVPGPPGPQN